MFFRINDVDIRKACKSPKMRLLSKLLVTLQPQWAPFVENMQSTQLKVIKQPFSVLAPQEPGSVLLRSQLAPQEQGRCSSGALAPEEPGSVLLRSPLRVGAPQEPGSVLLRSTPGSELLRSQGRCSSGAGARGGSCQERPSPTTQYMGPHSFKPQCLCQAKSPRCQCLLHFLKSGASREAETSVSGALAPSI